jgi:type III secretory pathway component EscV
MLRPLESVAVDLECNSFQIWIEVSVSEFLQLLEHLSEWSHGELDALTAREHVCRARRLVLRKRMGEK